MDSVKLKNPWRARVLETRAQIAKERSANAPKVYVECLDCESNFPLPSSSHPIPNHRGRDKSVLCSGSGKVMVPHER